MFTIEESRLRFEFSDDYKLVASDGEPNVKKAKNLAGTKDIDVFGFYEENVLFFEIKNFRGSPAEEIENLATEVAQKLRDTVAIITGASRNTTNDVDFWQEMHRRLGNPKKQIFLVFWLEEDAPHTNRGKPRLQTLTEKLKEKCKWLNAKISVQSLATQHLEGLTVASLPRLAGE